MHVGPDPDPDPADWQTAFDSRDIDGVIQAWYQDNTGHDPELDYELLPIGNWVVNATWLATNDGNGRVHYEELISVVVVYTFEKDLPERIADVQVVAHETWRIASKARASATREYIGSVQSTSDLVAGRGEFETSDDFYAYWRHSTRRWKKSPEAERLLRRALDDPTGR